MAGTLVKANGIELWARAEGRTDPEAPWLVFSNSLASDHTMWDGQVDLLGRHYRLLRYDTRGHGRSEAPAGDYSMAILVEDLRALLDLFGIARTTLVGLSLGGMTGLGMALTHPQRLERLVCCDARADAPTQFVRDWGARKSLVAERGVDAVADATIERWLAETFRRTEQHAVRRVKDMIVATPVQGYCGCTAALMGLDYRKEIGRIRLPVNFIVGEVDFGAPAEVMRDMAGAIPGATLDVIPGASHLPNIDSRDAFNSVIAGRLGIA